MATVQIVARLDLRDTEDVFCSLSLELGFSVPATAPLRSQLRAQRHAAETLLAMCRVVIGVRS